MVFKSPFLKLDHRTIQTIQGLAGPLNSGNISMKPSQWPMKMNVFFMHAQNKHEQTIWMRPHKKSLNQSNVGGPHLHCPWFSLIVKDGKRNMNTSPRQKKKTPLIPHESYVYTQYNITHILGLRFD